MANELSALPLGVYETPVTRRISERIAATQNSFEQLGVGIADTSKDKEVRSRFTEAVAQLVGTRLSQKLLTTRDEASRIKLINAIAELIDEDDSIVDEELLYAIYENTAQTPPVLPENSLTGATLLTNAAHDHNMSSEIRREITTADRVDLLCAFIKNSGISVIRDQLEYLRDNQIPLRVITSTYCGASDPEALNRLVEEFGATVKIGYESTTTRLHAKAWLFQRNSGFDTAYIGSSNLSNSALIDGVEWNVRTSRTTTPGVLEKFKAVFETYWNEPHYVTYDPKNDQARLKEAIHRAKFRDSGKSEVTLSGLRVEPYSYQRSMLEALAAEREVHDRHQNLVVAATGTGKTVVAALDYRSLVEKYLAEGQRKPSLLFVAHRRQLLEQARRMYREVLQDPNFGELLDGANEPTQWEHVFSTVQSMNDDVIAELGPKKFDIIVIDEFHHAEATSYRRIMDSFEPRELLGLTATPERGDGVNVQAFFDYRMAYELRLWDALRLQLLAPMHYYGINDETDLSQVRWSRQACGYDVNALSDLYIHSGDKRVKLILSEMQKRIFNLDDLKALGFCVSIPHAHFMADRFNAYGMPARAISSKNSDAERQNAIDALKSGEIKVLFTVDLFNEGVDIPEINTLLLLRPTQSPTIFLQQLGRGLRLHPGKDVCVVLDFIGQQSEEFEFEERYAAMTGTRGKRLIHEVEHGFSALPAGTSIQLDRVSTQRILKNLRKVARNTLPKLRALASNTGTRSLKEFIASTGIPLEDIYRSREGGGWTRILRSVNLLPQPSEHDEVEEFLLSRLRAMLHINDAKRADAYVRLASPNGPTASELSAQDLLFARMLYAQVFAHSNWPTIPKTLDEMFAMMRAVPAFAEELKEITDYTVSQSQRIPQPLQQFSNPALFTHCDYSRGELVGALSSKEVADLVHLPREGVAYFEEANLDLFLVTLVKSDKDFSETTSYHDYPISPELLHWQSQASTSLASPTAHRYINHESLGSTILMAMRNEKTNSLELASPFTLLGEVSYRSHQGEKPISFELSLVRPMPNQLFEQGRAVA